MRESIQNSLDAAAEGNKTVHVRFAFGETDFNKENLGEGLWEHVYASDKEDSLVDLKKIKKSRFLVIEDFETTGLLGDPQADDDQDWSDEEKKLNSFYYFVHAEGKSSKSGADRGSWGVGKYTFLDASRPNLMFIYTIRKETKANGGVGPLVIGLSVLPGTHKVNGQTYKPDGWWANHIQDENEEDIALPFTTESGIPQRIKEIFGLKREDNQSGLSVVVPYIYDEFTSGTLLKAVIRNYGVAIGWGSLTVSIEEGSNAFHLTQDNIRDLCYEQGLDDLLAELDLALWGSALKLDQRIELGKPIEGTEPNWDQKDPPLMTEDQAKLIRESIREKNIAIRVHVPVHIKKKNKTEWGFFDVYFTSSDIKVKPRFYRGGLRISDIDSMSPPDTRAIVVVEEGTVLARFLGDAEGPAHRTWKADTRRFRGKYSHGKNWISHITRAPSQIFRLAHSAENEEDKDLAIDFFFIEDEAGQDPNKKNRKGETGKVKRPEVPALNSGAFTWWGFQENGSSGFTMTVDSSRIKSETDISLKIAYDTGLSSAIKKYNRNDFLLDAHDQIKIKVRGGNLLEAVNNLIRVRITDPEDFKMTVLGFDPNRDLRFDHQAGKVS